MDTLRPILNAKTRDVVIEALNDILKNGAASIKPIYPCINQQASVEKPVNQGLISTN
jgi:hypothetical protein